MKGLDGAPVHFGKADLQQHLHRFRRAQVVDDVRSAALGNLHRPIGRAGVTHLAGKGDGVPGGRHRNLLVGQQRVEVALESWRVRGYLDRVESRRSGVIPQHQRRRAERLAVDQNFRRRDHDRLGHRGIAHGKTLKGGLVDHEDGRPLGHRHNLLRGPHHLLGETDGGRAGGSQQEDPEQRPGGGFSGTADAMKNAHGTPGIEVEVRTSEAFARRRCSPR